MEISNQLKEAATEMARRHRAEGIKLPAEIPGNRGMCLGTEKEKDKLNTFSVIEFEGVTYLIGSCCE